MGGRADIRMDWPLPAIQQRLRAALRIRRIADLHRDDTPHAGEVGGMIILKHPLKQERP